MRYLMKICIPVEPGNTELRNPQFSAKLGQYLQDVKAEAAYFTTVNGNRGGYIVVNIDDASQIPGIAEPLFLWLEAEIDFIPVMLPEDLGKAGPSIEAAIKKWG